MKTRKPPEKGKRIHRPVPPIHDSLLFREPTGERFFLSPAREYLKHSSREKKFVNPSHLSSRSKTTASRASSPVHRTSPSPTKKHPTLRRPAKSRTNPFIRFVRPIRGALRTLETYLPLIALAVLSVSLWFSPRTQLQSLTIIGAPPAMHPAIAEIVHQHWHEPIALHKVPIRIESQIAKWSWVQSVHYKPRSPHQAVLSVRPRTHWIAIRGQNGEKRFLDSAGFLFRSPNPPPTTPAGEIVLTEDQAMPPEGPITQTALKRAFHLLCALHEDGRVKQARINLPPSGELTLTCRLTRKPTVALQVRLGDASTLPRQISLICALLNTDPEQMQRWEYVDIKSPTAPALKIRSSEVFFSPQQKSISGTNREKKSRLEGYHERE